MYRRPCVFTHSLVRAVKIFFDTPSSTRPLIGRETRYYNCMETREIFHLMALIRKRKKRNFDIYSVTKKMCDNTSFYNVIKQTQDKKGTSNLNKRKLVLINSVVRTKTGQPTKFLRMTQTLRM